MRTGLESKSKTDLSACIFLLELPRNGFLTLYLNYT
jgi:hypothetical protein